MGDVFEIVERVLEIGGDIVGILFDIFDGEQEEQMNAVKVLKIVVKVGMVGVAVGKLIGRMVESSSSRRQFLRLRDRFEENTSDLFRDFVKFQSVSSYYFLEVRMRKTEYPYEYADRKKFLMEWYGVDTDRELNDAIDDYHYGYDDD